MTRLARFALVIVACAALWPGCGPGTPLTPTPTLVGPPASTLAPNAPPTASLSGIWVGNRPADGMVLHASGCEACGVFPFIAADVRLNISDSSHALSGNATSIVRDAPPPEACPAEPGCVPRPPGEVIPAAVTGAVAAGGHVTMHWTATLGGDGQVPTPVVFSLEGSVSSNRMAGTLVLTGAAVPGGSAKGTWSAILQ